MIKYLYAPCIISCPRVLASLPRHMRCWCGGPEASANTVHSQPYPLPLPLPLPLPHEASSLLVAVPQPSPGLSPKPFAAQGRFCSRTSVEFLSSVHRRPRSPLSTCLLSTLSPPPWVTILVDVTAVEGVVFCRLACAYLRHYWRGQSSSLTAWRNLIALFSDTSSTSPLVGPCVLRHAAVQSPASNTALW